MWGGSSGPHGRAFATLLAAGVAVVRREPLNSLSAAVLDRCAAAQPPAGGQPSRWASGGPLGALLEAAGGLVTR